MRKIKKKLCRLALFSLLSVFCSLAANAQQRTISGRVTDAAGGEPVIGAVIQVKGTSNGTSSDVDGKFSFTVPELGGTLVVSYLGYQTQELPLNKTAFDIALREDVTNLDEVVVIGYGEVKKRDLTGAVGSVTADRITGVGTNSVMSALQGATPGVDILTSSARPGSGFRIQIRGQNSLNPGNPLYVVDGIVVDDIDFLSPNDIQNIDVLKDASSTAIYGSRGSNGVVIIRTKGVLEGINKFSISYDGYAGVRSLARIPDFMDGREVIDYRTSMYYTWNPTAELFELSEANKTAVLQNSRNINTRLYNQDYVDWLNAGTDNGNVQSHSINIAGITGNMTYNIGGGYQKEKGNFMDEEMDRYTLRASFNHKATSWFSTGASINMSHLLVGTGSEQGYRDLFRMMPFFDTHDENGEYLRQPGIGASINGAGNFTSSGNPLIEIESGTEERKFYNVMGSVFAEITPVKGLSIKTTFMPRLSQRRVGRYYGITPDRTSDIARTEHRTRFEYTWDNVINYTRTFAEKHNVGLTLINEVYETSSESLAVGAEKFPNNVEWYNIFTGTLRPGDNSAGYSEETLLSWAARVNYDYAGKYLLTATVRRDGSSKLAEKWATFPSVALAWRITEEDFMNDSKWLSNLKLRASLGWSGNNNGVDPYGTQFSPATGTPIRYDFNGTMIQGFAPGTPVNTMLTWEKTREINVGLDFGLIGGRISGSLDWYDKLSDGLLMGRNLSRESGVDRMTDNIGSVNNRGIELGLSTVNVKTKNMEWRTSFVFSRNKNAIRSLYGKEEDVPSESRFIGEPINVLYDYKVDGTYSLAEWKAASADERNKMKITNPGAAKVLDITGDGEITTDDRVILYQIDPKWTGSLTSTLKVYGFDFSFNIYARQGTHVSDAFSAEFLGAALTDRGRPKVNFDYYVPEGAPRIDWNNFDTDPDGQKWVTWGTSTEHVGKYPIGTAVLNGGFYGNNGRYQDVSFIKVRNITLGYSLPKNVLQYVKLEQFRVYLNVMNPFVFTDYIGWDPEWATSGQGGSGGGNGPSSIVYQAGVNLKF
ncbi:MAG: TonB-dependent receptor [Tannerella sp.]|jgi:TonB-linked SusC/RagA family outer membrane protein|nr:TonB-dependent receptor [Tannerella sp.]